MPNFWSILKASISSIPVKEHSNIAFAIRDTLEDFRDFLIQALESHGSTSPTLYNLKASVYEPIIQFALDLIPNEEWKFWILWEKLVSIKESLSWKKLSLTIIHQKKYSIEHTDFSLDQDEVDMIKSVVLNHFSK